MLAHAYNFRRKEECRNLHASLGSNIVPAQLELERRLCSPNKETTPNKQNKSKQNLKTRERHRTEVLCLKMQADYGSSRPSD